MSLWCLGSACAEWGWEALEPPFTPLHPPPPHRLMPQARLRGLLCPHGEQEAPMGECDRKRGRGVRVGAAGSVRVKKRR